MTQPVSERDHISDYERAVCYYTLPKTTHPVTFGLILVYAFICLEALATIGYGLLRQDDLWIRMGIVGLAAIVIFGIIVFTVRAVLNEFTRYRALAAAHGVPDAPADAPELPDPFAGHLLIRRPITPAGAAYTCTDRQGAVLYTVAAEPDIHWRTVTDPAGREVLRCHIRSTRSSFAIDGTVPSRLEVHVGGDVIARLRRRFTFNVLTLEIQCYGPAPKRYTVRNESLYRDNRLVGRIYLLRNFLYLDVKQDEFHDALLAFFVAMS